MFALGAGTEALFLRPAADVLASPCGDSLRVSVGTSYAGPLVAFATRLVPQMVLTVIEVWRQRQSRKGFWQLLVLANIMAVPFSLSAFTCG